MEWFHRNKAIKATHSRRSVWPVPDHQKLQALGVRVVVDFPDGAHIGRLRRIWSRSMAPADGPAGPCAGVPASIFRGASDYTEIADLLSTHVTLAAIEQQAGRLIMMHAAGLIDPDSGRAIALVGPSGCGKSTATKALAGRFWGYLSDETVAVEPTSLAVLPHPKPLSLCTAVGGPKTQLGADELGLAPTPATAKLGRVILLARNPHWKGRPVVEEVGLTEAIAELTPELSFMTAFEAPLTALAQMLNSTGGALRVTYAEANDLAGVLSEFVAWPARQANWSRFEGDAPRMEAGLVSRSPFIEAIIDHDDGSLVLAVRPTTVSGQPTMMLLSALGAKLWEFCEEPTTLPVLTDRLVKHFGMPPGPQSAAALTRRAVTDLVHVGGLQMGSTGD